MHAYYCFKPSPAKEPEVPRQNETQDEEGDEESEDEDVVLSDDPDSGMDTPGDATEEGAAQLIVDSDDDAGNLVGDGGSSDGGINCAAGSSSSSMLGSVAALPTESVDDKITELEKKLSLAKKVLTAKNLGYRNVLNQFYHIDKSRMGHIAG